MTLLGTKIKMGIELRPSRCYYSGEEGNYYCHLYSCSLIRSISADLTTVKILSGILYKKH